MLIGEIGGGSFYLQDINDLYSSPHNSQYVFSDTGTLCHSTRVEDLNLPQRLYDKLLEKNVTYLTAFSSYTVSLLKRDFGLSTQMANKLLVQLKNIYLQPVTLIKTPIGDAVFSFAEILLNLGYSTGDAFFLLNEYSEYITITETTDRRFFLTEESLQYFYTQTDVTKKLQMKILNILSNNNLMLKESQLSELIKPQLTNSTLKIMLAKLEQEGKVFQLEDSWVKKEKPILEYISSLSELREKEIIKQRFEGKTLDEIGQEHDITRERVRQIVNKFFLKCPLVYEDIYKEFIETYSVSHDAFLHIFSVQRTTYFYLITKYKLGEKPLDQGIDDALLPLQVRKSIEAYCFRNHIFIDEDKILPNFESIVTYLLKIFCQSNLNIEDFFAKYEDFIKIHSLDLVLSFRNFKARLERHDNALMKYNQRVRYYPIEEYDYTFLKDILCSGVYEDVELSTLAILTDFPELVAQYNLQDEYELHNLIKKLGLIEGFPITLGRMPMITFGNGNRDNQVLDLLIATAPVTPDKLAEEYRKLYGVREATVKANLLSHLLPYLHDGYYKIDLPILNNKELSIMKETLTEDYYLMGKIKAVYRNIPHNEDYEPKKINAYSLNLLGFTIYSNQIISNRYSSLVDYARSFLSKNIFDFSSAPPTFRTSPTFYAEIYQQKRNREIIELTPGKYIRKDYLESSGMDTLLIKDFCNAVFRHKNNKKIFTITSLTQEGFRHKIYDWGFSDWFYGALLAMDSRFSLQRAGKTRIFIADSGEVRLIELIGQIVFENGAIDRYELLDYLQDVYGVEFSLYRLMPMLDGSSLYYSSIMEKIYKSYETYFMEV